ncbi:MAG: hypothetical protein D6737_19745 [Chloroflexi bacterium]|nr:MAG: hypothetical protein CUN54_04320 [Phototrophicales bacterium]RMF76681.1 MAG: hypothetical protein D6737_19745 [Chloroflexota bacterium]
MQDSGKKVNYGFVSDLFVTRRPNKDTIILGGVDEQKEKWTRLLSPRAAQMLWFHLTQILYPDKSDMVTALVATTPLRTPHLPTITTHTNIITSDPAAIEVTGWAGEFTWDMLLSDYEARRLWTALDLALFPSGWQDETE